jgi:hypothetical protein
MTYLELVNDVLLRLREQTVTTVNLTTYYDTLKNPIYRGVYYWGNVAVENAHEPIITPEQAEEIDRILSTNKATLRRPSKYGGAELVGQLRERRHEAHRSAERSDGGASGQADELRLLRPSLDGLLAGLLALGLLGGLGLRPAADELLALAAGLRLDLGAAGLDFFSLLLACDGRRGRRRLHLFDRRRTRTAGSHLKQPGLTLDAGSAATLLGGLLGQRQ